MTKRRKAIAAGRAAGRRRLRIRQTLTPGNLAQPPTGNQTGAPSLSIVRGAVLVVFLQRPKEAEKA